MSAADRAVVDYRIRQLWPGEKMLPKRGLIHVPPVREGGVTDAFIKLAVEVADQHYRKVIRDLLVDWSDEDGCCDHVSDLLSWLDEE